MLYKADQTRHLYLLFHKCAITQLSVSVDELTRPGPDLPIGVVGLSQEPQDLSQEPQGQGGLQQTVVRIESTACVLSGTHYYM